MSALWWVKFPSLLWLHKDSIAAATVAAAMPAERLSFQ
jgi:hypothetical protein